ncbi:flagellar filament capping protein FliD [Blastococcus sp. SYSU D00922]
MTMSLSTGLISGMDTGTLISQLIQAEAGPQTALRTRLKASETAASAYRTVNTTFLAVTAAAEAAMKPGAWNPTKATSSNGTVSFTATAGAASNSLTFTVKQLATSHAVMNRNSTPGTWTSPTSSYGATEITVSDEKGVASPTKITVGGTGTLADAAAAINASSHGLSASVVQISSGEAALRVVSKETGLASKFSLSGAGAVTTNVDAADAVIVLGTPGATGAVEVSSATNTFDSVMPGGTFTVSKKDETATLSIASDPDAVAATVQSLINAVNAAAKNARDYTSNAPGSTATLKGDYAVSSLGSRLLDNVTAALGANGSPAKIGIQLAKDGKSVVFDKTVFLAALKDDPAKVQTMVLGTPATTDADGKLVPAVDGLAGRLLTVSKGASDSATGSLVALANGQDGLKKGYQEQIDAWDLRLAKRKETLTRQFTAMETALSSLRNQSTWLASQINSLPSAG